MGIQIQDDIWIDISFPMLQKTLETDELGLKK